MISNWQARLCKMHSMRFSKVKPEQRCQCYHRVRDGWSCDTCCDDTLYNMRLRAVSWRNDLFFTHVRGKGKLRKRKAGERKVYLDHSRARKAMACPVPGCGRMPYYVRMLGAVRKMEMCLACCAVQVA